MWLLILSLRVKGVRKPVLDVRLGFLEFLVEVPSRSFCVLSSSQPLTQCCGPSPGNSGCLLGLTSFQSLGLTFCSFSRAPKIDRIVEMKISALSGSEETTFYRTSLSTSCLLVI